MSISCFHFLVRPVNFLTYRLRTYWCSPRFLDFLFLFLFFHECLASDRMGFVGSLLGIIGFGIGIPLGLLLGFFLFIYIKPGDVKVINTSTHLSSFFSSLVFLIINNYLRQNRANESSVLSGVDACCILHHGICQSNENRTCSYRNSYGCCFTGKLWHAIVVTCRISSELHVDAPPLSRP